MQRLARREKCPPACHQRALLLQYRTPLLHSPPPPSPHFFPSLFYSLVGANECEGRVEDRVVQCAHFAEELWVKVTFVFAWSQTDRTEQS
ncbi:hypothetical protein NQZ68_005699 [Dissostichus eleginoides]|nr:hypothetical protein NQZ68_005699 [Dissostichus eleginoides]